MLLIIMVTIVQFSVVQAPDSLISYRRLRGGEWGMPAFIVLLLLSSSHLYFHLLQISYTYLTRKGAFQVFKFTTKMQTEII